MSFDRARGSLILDWNGSKGMVNRFAHRATRCAQACPQLKLRETLLEEDICSCDNCNLGRPCLNSLEDWSDCTINEFDTKARRRKCL